ncbi:MAG: HAD-IIB family hydrolase [Sphaerochaetaceae bacterium]|nr:HAD-IIB family hydrolase [Sphaerochaetaceae bacterium]
MKNITEINKALTKSIKYVLCDVDDTLTYSGKLPSSTYEALWKLKKEGLAIILITGGATGFGETFVRMWPVDAVISESGAIVSYEEGCLKRILHPNAIYNTDAKMVNFKNRILKEVEGSRIAKDQYMRLFDVAFDYAQEEPVLDKSIINKIISICDEEKIQCAQSSIHINTWLGHYSKLEMTRSFLESHYKWTDKMEEVLYFGDAPNDNPMFSYFDHCVKVNTKTDYGNLIKPLPEFTTKEFGGFGFAEAVTEILQKRNK